MGNLTLNLPLSLMLIFLLGYLGYRIFRFFHIPGGAITGSLLLVAIFSGLGVRWADNPYHFNTLFQVVLGIVIGCKFDKETVSSIKSVFVPGLLIAVWTMGICFGMGVLLAKVTGLDLGTALYGSIPGGLSEIGLLAIELNLNVPVVTLFQFMRVIAVYVCVPAIAIRYGRKFKEEAAANAPSLDGELEKRKWKMPEILCTLIVGGAGGFIAKGLGVPVGGLLGAMTAIGILRIMGVPLKVLPRSLVVFAQIGLGGYLGTTFTPEVVASLHRLIIPVIVFSVAVVLSGIIIGILVHRYFGLELVTSLLACSAAGVTQMSVIALDMDADAVIVGVIQTMRFAFTMMIMPGLILLLI